MTLHEALVAVRLGIVVAGGLAGLWSLRLAYASTRARWAYLLLGIGFGLIAFGAIAEGLLYEFAGWDLLAAHSVEALVSIAGFSSILGAIVRSRL
jgi:hypothetical protein